MRLPSSVLEKKNLIRFNLMADCPAFFQNHETIFS